MTTLDRKSALRRGSCPGVYTPMESGDGLLLRVRTSARVLTSADLTALASLAERHGNGVLELTRRANLQLRGVHDLAGLQAGLVQAGLAHVDPTHERRLAPLLVDPLLEDARDFERALVSCAYEPSAKLAIAIEGATPMPAADLRVRLDGALAHVALGSTWLGSCARARAAAVVVQLLQAEHPALDEHAEPPALARRSFLGQHDGWFGVALPFGSAPSSLFTGLAKLVRSIRVTPARELLLHGVTDASRLRALGLIVDRDDPLSRVVACPGAPACGSALGNTRLLGRELAALGLTLHVSGCEKGCASSAVHQATLVRAPGGVRLAFDGNVDAAAAQPVLPLEEARRQLANRASITRVGPPMARKYDYVREGAEIYRRSFAIIRSEARLSRFSAAEERVAVRLIHTCGMVDLADDIVFSPGFAEAATAALRRGAPILCDAKMIVSGVTRARLAQGNELLCFLDQPGLASLAKEQQNTRSAAALEYWKPRLDGALVAIGNAPTALFRLLELFDELHARPAAVIGLPVGFVGAAESKDALLEDGRVPALIVRGRRGGSAMTVAAINALASDEE
ncbi:MAG TPA: precorrin-8X methylmutase [Polyangiales bacterium]|nr:precorrin-8X methylmutase [Polyangiales bacterium]